MIEIKNVSKRYGEQIVLNNVSLTINKGDTLVLLAPSGGGKSTLVKTINALVPIDKGDILINGKSIKTMSVVDHAKHTGMVFQAFGLIENLNVLQNVTVALIHVLGMTKDNAEKIALSQLKRLGVEKLKGAMPLDLSGGQKQRVAIARTLAMSPQCIIFDEATSGLDVEKVSEVLAIIEDLVKHENLTAIIVTHELAFAKKIANRIVFMENGSILEDTSAEQFFTKPKTDRAAQFLRKVIR